MNRILLFSLLAVFAAHAGETSCANCAASTVITVRSADGAERVVSRATSPVNIQGFRFVLADIIIQAGDTVTWTNKDSSAHTATSDTNVFNSGDLALNESYSFTFTTPGEYPYYCAIHHDMRGKITVTPPVAPVITSATTAMAVAGEPFQYQITAANSPLSFDATNLPSGLTLNAGGLINGVPQSPEAARVIGLSATNLGGTGNGTLTLQIVLPPAPLITSATQASAQVGEAFSYQLAADRPAAFQIGSVPPGLTAASSGLLAGIPTQAGTFQVALTASALGGTDSRTLTLTVAPPQPVVFSGSFQFSLVKGFPASIPIQVSGKPPLTFSILSGAAPLAGQTAGLPTGLALQGAALSGTPTQAGTFVLDVLAANAFTQAAQMFTLSISDPESGGDVDGDGFSDELELALNTSPLDAASTPQNVGAGASAPLAVSRLNVRLNFAASRKDTLDIAGTFPLPDNFNPVAQPVVLDVGGLSRLFTLTARGKATAEGAIFQLTVGKPRTAGGGQAGNFTARFGPGSFGTAFGNEQMDERTVSRDETRTVKVVLIAAGRHFSTIETLKFSNPRGRVAQARK